MEGAELAEEIFHMPVVGAPCYARGLHDIIRTRSTRFTVCFLYGVEAFIEDDRKSARIVGGNEFYRPGKRLLRATFLDRRKTVLAGLCVLELF